MKKILLGIVMLMAGMGVQAQNIQLHYDLGNPLYGKIDKRPAITTTVEMFKPDKWGSTYFFSDFDYYGDGMAGAYWEISREFKFTHAPRFAIHGEYDGGLTSFKDSSAASRFQHAALVGGAYNWLSTDFNKNFSVQVMYKQYFKGQGRKAFSSFQVTGVWGITFGHGLGSFLGFVDVWFDPDVNGKLIVLSEPQIWFNFNALKGWEGINLSIGSEVEISNNFVYDKNGRNNKFFAIPTVALKWTF